MALLNGGPREFFLLGQEQLVIADVFRPQPIERDSKVPGEVSQAPDVRAPGAG
jgi:hypothetical protein